MPGHHGTFVAIITGLVVFTASVQLRGDSPAWDVPLIAGALLVAVGWGGLAADLTGAPAPLWSAGVVALFSLHGSTFLAWRLLGRSGERACALARSLVPPCLLLVPAVVLLAEPVRRPGLALVGAVAVLAPLLGARVTSGRTAFACTALASALPVPVVFAAQDVVHVETMAHHHSGGADPGRARGAAAGAAVPVGDPVDVRGAPCVTAATRSCSERSPSRPPCSCWRRPTCWRGCSAEAGGIGLPAWVVGARAVLVGVQRVCVQRTAATVKARLRKQVPADAMTRRGDRAGEVSTLVTRGLDAIEPFLAGYLPQLAVAAVVPLAARRRPCCA